MRLRREPAAIAAVRVIPCSLVRPFEPRRVVRLAFVPGIAALVGTLALATPVAAQGRAQRGGKATVDAPAKEQASELKRKGDEFMINLRFAEALAAFDEAYALDANPALLYNRGRALQLLDRLPEALDAFEKFRAEAPPELLGKVPKLGEAIAEIQGKLTTLTVTTEPGGVQVLVGGREVGTTPLASPLRLKRVDGTTIEFRREGYHALERKLDLARQETPRLAVTLQPKDKTALLLVRSPVAGARVDIDGKSVGNAPSESYLQPGPHTVVVSGAGYEDAEVKVALAAGERKSVDVPLTKTPPVYKRWWFWTAIGVGTAAIVGGVLAGTLERPASVGDIQPGQISAPLVTF